MSLLCGKYNYIVIYNVNMILYFKNIIRCHRDTRIKKQLGWFRQNKQVINNQKLLSRQVIFKLF